MVAPPLPCCVVLHQVTPLPGSNALGVALVRQLILPPPLNTAVTVAAHALPDPSDFGSFDAYEGVVVTDRSEFRFRLFASPEPAPTWAGTRADLPGLTRGTSVAVRPVNTETDAAGPVQLAGTLANCRGS